MTEVPKIVHDRLRAASLEHAASGPGHPDADLLTAFAEQALAATERDGVLAHLALCGDCREVVALALPAAESVGAPIAMPAVPATISRAGAPAPHKLSFAWPSLRWAALAAGVAVAASVLLMHPGKLNQATTPSADRQVATTEPPASNSQIASSPVAKSAIAPSSADKSAALARTDEARLKPEMRLAKKLNAGQGVTPSRQVETGILLADNKDSKKDASEADKVSAAPAAGAPVLDAPTMATETVEVSGAAVALQTESSSVNSVMARNQAPAIAKAKPAPQDKAVAQPQKARSAAAQIGERVRDMMPLTKQESPASQSMARYVTWAITAGVLQRSVDSGQSWQNALRADHLLLCYAGHDQDVWAGGQAGTLFHSVDSGVTWVQVQPIKGQGLTSDITHIDMRGDVHSNIRSDAHSVAEIVLSTSNNETWSSSDAGKTWEKK